MTSDKKNSAHTQEIKARLKVLKKKGLYKGDLRKAPTRYAAKLANDFADVASGRAQVVSIPVTKGRGSKAAFAKAHELAERFSGTMRAKGNKVIVRVSHTSEKPIYFSAKDTIATSYTDSAGRRMYHEYLHADGSALPILSNEQTYALPFSRGVDGISYTYRATEAEILELANQYETKEKNPYVGAIGHIQLVSIGAPARAPKARKPVDPDAPPKAPKKKKTKSKRKTAKIIDLATERAKRSKK